MVNGILGKKLGMTQVFDETGRVVPVTVIEAGPCVVSQIKTEDKDGYEAIQLAFGDIAENRMPKPMNQRKKERADAEQRGTPAPQGPHGGPVNLPAVGHFKKSGVHAKRHIREVSVDSLEDVTLGQEFKADLFSEGDLVKVTGISKGKGFAGAMKRWHFHGGDASHGSTVRRKPQSGGGTDAARTFKGVKRPGRMGGKRITQRGLTVHRVDADRNVILIRGAVPGANGGLVMVARQLVGG